MITQTTETLGQVAELQPVVTAALRTMIAEHGYGALANVTRQVTAFGTYVIDVRPLTDEEAGELLFEEMVNREIDGYPFDESLALRYCDATGMEYDYVRSDVREAAAAVAEVNA
jgi:hypothetical protein